VSASEAARGSVRSALGHFKGRITDKVAQRCSPQAKAVAVLALDDVHQSAHRESARVMHMPIKAQALIAELQ